jgi:SIR2-like domain
MFTIESPANEIIIFLGAVASIRAGVSGVKEMVTKFIQKLEREPSNLHKVTKDVVDLLSSWKNGGRDVDIELLLETIEKLENRRSDVMSLFYTAKNSVLKKFEELEIDMKLSAVLKQFVKAETGKVDLQPDYLKGLLIFMEFYKPLHIFSTNYDVCIERFGELNYKSYFDGFFDGMWDATKSNEIDKDFYLYKLHGSVTWSRDEKGRYTRNEIAITDTAEPQINIISGEKEVPLIS